MIKENKITILLEELQSLLFMTILIMLTFLIISLLTWTSPFNFSYSDTVSYAYIATTTAAIVRIIHRIKHEEE